MKIVFIRHTRVNVPQGTCYGQTDVPLADSFLQEAHDVRIGLKSYEPFTKVFTSPLSRACKLADFCGYQNAQTDNRLMEMNLGEWEMQRYDDIKDSKLQAWYKDYLHIPATGGESFQQLYTRVKDFIEELLRTFPNDSCVAAFSHAGVLMSAMLYAKMFPESDIFKHQPQYGGILELDL